MDYCFIKENKLIIAVFLIISPLMWHIWLSQEG